MKIDPRNRRRKVFINEKGVKIIKQMLATNEAQITAL